MKLDNKTIITIVILAIATVSVVTLVALEQNKTEMMPTENSEIPTMMAEDIDLSKSEIDSRKLHFLTVENLIGNLIEKYDETGLEGMQNANFVAHLTGNSNGTRYLYIVDPEVGVIGKPDQSFGLQVALPPLNEDDALWIGYDDRFPSSNLKDIKIQRYFKMHDGLIFISGFPVDTNGIPK